MRTSLLTALAFATLAAACGGQYVESPVFDPEARVRKSDDTLAIADLMETYERALAGLDIATIRSLVSEDYYENAATTDTTRDDFGFEGLEAVFATLADHVDDIDVDIAVRAVTVEGDAADVRFEYTFRMRYTVGEEDHWETERDVNRFELQREEAGWRIVSGL